MVPALVVAEVAYLLGRRLGYGAELRFVASIADGELAVANVGARDWVRIVDLVWQYRDLGLGTTDASIVAAGERLEITTLATLDRRHFTVIRPAHVDAFELVP